MAEGNNWNLTIIAVVALVALVSLVALVMNTLRVPVATGVQPSVAAGPERNIAGQLIKNQDWGSWVDENWGFSDVASSTSQCQAMYGSMFIYCSAYGSCAYYSQCPTGGTASSDKATICKKAYDSCLVGTDTAGERAECKAQYDACLQ